MKILFLAPYPQNQAPSQRFRFEQYLPVLSQQGHYWEFHGFLDSASWRILFVRGQALRKAVGVMEGFLRRSLLLARLHAFDAVFLHREAAPLGPPVFEWIIAKVWRKPLIYDFDDAIWLPDNIQEGRAMRWLKYRSKVALICRWSRAVSAGNDYLAAFARQHAPRVVVNPTTIDTEQMHNPAHFRNADHRPGRVVIGWTGSHSTLKYLKGMEPVLKQLSDTYAHVHFLFIADQPPSLALPRTTFVPWSLETEISALAAIDIGIMPLPDDAWANGKCGFKALQYMALEKAAVVSPVGVNTTIVTDGSNGLLAATPEQWHRALEQLIQDPALRQRLGQAGRLRVQRAYSVVSNTERFLSLFDK